MVQTKTTIKEYLDSLPKESRGSIEKLHKLITESIPKDIKPVMWEGVFWGGSEQRIIGYGEYKYTRKKEILTWFVAGLTQQKNYISIFIIPVEGGEYIAEKNKDKLGKVKVGRSSIGFKNIEDINLDALREVIKKAFNVKG